MAITTSVKPKLTYEDYASLPDDERCELIDGELIPPCPRQRRFIRRFSRTWRRRSWSWNLEAWGRCFSPRST